MDGGIIGLAGLAGLAQKGKDGKEGPQGPPGPGILLIPSSQLPAARVIINGPGLAAGAITDVDVLLDAGYQAIHAARPPAAKYRIVSFEIVSQPNAEVFAMPQDGMGWRKITTPEAGLGVRFVNLSANPTNAGDVKARLIISYSA